MTENPSSARIVTGAVEGTSHKPDVTETPRASTTPADQFFVPAADLALDAACFQALFQHGLDAMIQVDGNGSITAWNRRAESLFGWSASEAIGRPVTELIIPARLRPAQEAGLKRFLITRQGPVINQRFETLALSRDGSEFPVEVAVTVVHIARQFFSCALVRDKTPERQRDQERHQAEDWLRTAIANAPVILYALAPGAVVTSIQGKGLEALGLRPEDIIGRTIYDIYPNEPLLHEAVRRGFRGETSPIMVELAGQSLEVHQVPQRDAEGHIRGITGAIINVTGFRRAAEQLRATAEALQKRNAALQRSNQELDEFTHIVAHDLKEPLRGIQTYAGLLIEGYGDRLDVTGRSRLEVLRQLGDRLDQQLEALLEFSRVGRVDLAKRDVDLNQVLSRTLFSLGFALQERGVLVRIPRPLPTVRCDPHRIGEVYANLIGNAVKYNDKAEKWIEIGWHENGLPRLDLAETPDYSRRPAAEQASPPVFYVRDNGIGIEPQHFAAIFRVFKRLHGNSEFGGGSGMGLTLVKKILERHGGRVWVESTYKEGTTFFFTLEPGGGNGGANHGERQTLSNPPNR